MLSYFCQNSLLEICYILKVLILVNKIVRGNSQVQEFDFSATTASFFHLADAKGYKQKVSQKKVLFLFTMLSGAIKDFREEAGEDKEEMIEKSECSRGC